MNPETNVRVGKEINLKIRPVFRINHNKNDKTASVGMPAALKSLFLYPGSRMPPKKDTRAAPSVD
jgi:hypothetical protein